MQQNPLPRSPSKADGASFMKLPALFLRDEESVIVREYERSSDSQSHIGPDHFLHDSLPSLSVRYLHSFPYFL